MVEFVTPVLAPEGAIVSVTAAPVGIAVATTSVAMLALNGAVFDAVTVSAVAVVEPDGVKLTV